MCMHITAQDQVQQLKLVEMKSNRLLPPSWADITNMETDNVHSDCEPSLYLNTFKSETSS